MNFTKIRSIFCLGGLLTFLVSPRQAYGLIGGDLAAAQLNNDFFTFFNFAPVSTDHLPDGQDIFSFKPTGEAFRALVTLRVTSNSDGYILKLELAIARSFIDDRSKCIYAADLARSFLLRAAETRPGDAVSSLANEINVRAMKSSSVTILTRQMPPTSSAETEAFATYAGRESVCRLAYTNKTIELKLENVEEQQSSVLLLTVSRT